jgi:site-specific DNA-methyltransferase (adenine-specific)
MERAHRINGSGNLKRAVTNTNRIILGENTDVLPALEAKSARMIYIDPPFNTGKVRRLDRLRVNTDDSGDRVGFGGKRYRVERSGGARYGDDFDDFLGYLMPRIELSLRSLADDGSLFVHLDWRESHYVKVALDGLLGRDCFMNEIIWAYDYGGRPKKKWPAKHDTILWYVMNPKDYVFDYDAMERIPYMAPGLVTKEKAARGKTPTDVWWHTIVGTSGKERTGYPTQKPLGVVGRLVKVHTEPGDVVLDYFAGSGTTGEAAAANDRRFVLIDRNPEAVDVMERRLAAYEPIVERNPIQAD